MTRNIGDETERANKWMTYYGKAVGADEIPAEPWKCKKNVVLYSAVSRPLDRSMRRALYTFCPLGRPVHSDINSASPGSILVMQQLRATTKSLTFPPLSIAIHVLIYTAESTGASMERTKMPNLRNGGKRGIRTRAHLIASSEFYRAPLMYGQLWNKVNCSTAS